MAFIQFVLLICSSILAIMTIENNLILSCIILACAIVEILYSFYQAGAQKEV